MNRRAKMDIQEDNTAWMVDEKNKAMMYALV